MAKKSSKKEKSIYNENSLQFLKKYINNPSPTGFESEGQKLWLSYIKPYIDNYFDSENYYNIYMEAMEKL
jgi:putative aminopeptidase FrvX